MRQRVESITRSCSADATAVVVVPAVITMAVELVLEVFEDFQCLQLNIDEEGKAQDELVEL